VAGCFSFYPGKNLGAFGEAGAVVTNSEELQNKIRVLRDHGQAKKYHHSCIGWNARMDGIQAAVLSVKLKHLEAANTRRRVHAQEYSALLAGCASLVPPVEAAYSHHVYHIYAVRVPERDRVLRSLSECGIACGIHYPVPLHLQEAYQFLGYARGAFPVTERCAEEFLSLPMYPELTTVQVEAVTAALKHTLSAAPELYERAV